MRNENSATDRYMFVGVGFNANLYTPTYFNATNITSKNMENISFYHMYFRASTICHLNVQNSYAGNITSLVPYMLVSEWGTAQFTNITFENFSSGASAMNILLVEELTIDGLVLRNYTGSQNPSGSVIPMLLVGTATFTNLVVKDSNFYQSTIFSSATTGTQFYFTDSSFSNSIISTAISLSNFHKLEVTNLSLLNVSGTSEQDESSVLIELPSWNMGSEHNLSISGMTVESSLVSLIEFQGLSGTPSSTKVISITNMTIFNTAYTSRRQLINTEGLSSEHDIQVVFADLTFTSLEFPIYGDLLYMRHQLLSSIVVRDSDFSNLTETHISAESLSTSREELATKVSFENCTFAEIHSDTDSFMLITSGAIIEVNDSIFSSMSVFGQGSVFKLQENAEATISQSNFTHNSAKEGAVFNIESESVIKCYD